MAKPPYVNKIAYKRKIAMTIIIKIGFLKIPSNVFHSSLSFLAFKKLNIYNITNVLKIKVKCLDGPISASNEYVYSYFEPSIVYLLPDVTKLWAAFEYFISREKLLYY